MPNILKLASYDDPVLRTKTESVSFPLSKEDIQLIADMKYSIQTPQLIKAKAPFKSAAGMAANQWGVPKRIFVYCPEGNAAEILEVAINPSYEPHPRAISLEEWEGCFSIPLATGKIKRFSHIKVKYQNEVGEWIERELTDYHARVWQHENDHLNGFLYDDPRTGKCQKKMEFATNEELEAFYRKKET